MSLRPTNPPFLQVILMETLTQIPVLFAAAQYSLAYLLCGGGIVGAAGIYVVAKMLGK
jgi:hypothetical protein